MVGAACRQANTLVIASQGSREREIRKEGEKTREGRGEQRAISGHGPLVAMAMTSG